LKAGKILHRFTAKDGREIILRIPKWEDLDDLLELINSITEEDLDFMPHLHKNTRDEEIEWLAKRLVEVEKDGIIDIVAEVNGKVISNSEVALCGGVMSLRRSVMSHVGLLGISIRSGYRGIGLGTEMLKILFEESRKIGLKILFLHVFSNNKRARHVYEKVGFNETGRIPKGLYRNGKFIDDVIMVKELK
jgi:RimJ/RimL family protein N-acetyltransferase